MPIDPPYLVPPPKWASVLINAANNRNRARGSDAKYDLDDLKAAWDDAEGCCKISGLEFSLEVVGDGQAKRPFAPSLDRITRHDPYTRSNVRLVVAVANFAMNAWGEGPLFRLSAAVHRRHGESRTPKKNGPRDSDLSNVAALEAEVVETDRGMLPFPPRSDLCKPILELLRSGQKSSRTIEQTVANHFQLTQEQRTAGLAAVSGYPAWRNHVAWALADLGTNKRGQGKIERIESKPAPGGGSMGIYRLIRDRDCSTPTDN